jgi:hypothetical protein
MKTAVKGKAAAEEEIERFRQLVIAARSTPSVGPQAEECLGRLNALYRQNPGLFSEEDARWLNVLRGYLGVRLAAHRPAGKHTRKPKRKGDTLDHCWRCGTPVDERFTEVCPECSDPKYQWRVCPVCRACGCQRSGKLLV